jgi:hypothetical protein
MSTITVGFGMDLAMDIIDGSAAWFPIYLSNWALFVENCYLSAAFVIALWIYAKQPDPASEQPFSTKVAWLLRSTGQSGALVVSVSYWALVHNGQITLKTLWIHAINSFVVCVDILTSCYEIRLMHYAYVLAFGGVYIIWTVIHYHANVRDGRSPSNRYIYSAIVWSQGSEGEVRKSQSRISAHQQRVCAISSTSWGVQAQRSESPDWQTPQPPLPQSRQALEVLRRRARGSNSPPHRPGAGGSSAATDRSSPHQPT